MDADRWQRLSPLLDALLELDEAARAASLASLRDDDPQLADDLEELLALEAGSDFLNEPLITPHPGVHAGASVGPYALERMLGEGGMGQVWLARRADGLYERRVALQRLRSLTILRAGQLLYVAISCFVGTSLAVAVDTFTGHKLGSLPIWLASIGVMSMFAASLLLARESTLAVTAINEEMDHRPRRPAAA